ncbi:hypothetical protein LSM04_004399 [Trypanosoma melophagium]|uniref:uncharacterized protein n=1 Tax=Trypanosoma melophagium TaxID=715481 RepID=UPI00351A1F36|nr:hypothetical protein LSM04_004399 [Trypanosoma melophagium]
MEILGRGGHSIMSIAASATTPSGFASLDSAGSVLLWDTRLKRKDYVRMTNNNNNCTDGCNSLKENIGEATELMLASDLHIAAVLADDTVTMYDLRQQSVLQFYKHSSETVVFLNGTHPVEATSTLIIDENGAIIPFDLKNGVPTKYLSQRYFGVEKNLSKPSFGSLSNYCCAFGFIQQSGNPFLSVIGMDGNGALYTDPLLPPVNFSIMDDLVSADGQLVNPPLPTTCSFFEDYVAIGRANGMYSIATMDDSGSLTEIFAAPGHASNGLCFVSWTPSGHLITCSLCGEVSAWDVLSLLQDESSEEVEEGDLPPLILAYGVRESTGKQSVVNCGATLGSGVFVAGDTMGFVTSCPLSQG